MKRPPCSLRNPCPDRSPTCHSTCKDFIEWEAVHAADRDRINELRRREGEATRYEIERNRKLKKRRNGK